MKDISSLTLIKMEIIEDDTLWKPSRKFASLINRPSFHSKAESTEQQPCSWQRFNLAQGHYSRADFSNKVFRSCPLVEGCFYVSYITWRNQQLNQIYEWANTQINTRNNRLEETTLINAACALPRWGMILSKGTLNIDSLKAQKTLWEYMSQSKSRFSLFRFVVFLLCEQKVV